MGWVSATSLVVARCGDGECLRSVWRWGPLRHGLLWLTTWFELAGGLGRTSPSGGAVACLEPPRRLRPRRYVAVLGGGGVVLSALAIGLAVVVPVLILPLALAVVAMLVAGLRRLCRQRPQWRALRAATPQDGWRVSNLSRLAADEHKGAGMDLLCALAVEADRAGRVLYLDTTAATLIGHYRRVGFEVVATADFGGFEVTRMVRLPGTPLRKVAPGDK